MWADLDFGGKDSSMNDEWQLCEGHQRADGCGWARQVPSQSESLGACGGASAK